MPFTDTIQDHFNSSDEAAFNAAVTAIMTVLQGRLRNLSEQENINYGFIKEKNKLFVNKVDDFNSTQPNLSSGDVDWVEFKSDKFDRKFLENGALQLISVAKQMLETKRLHDYDNFQSALIDKRYAIYKSKSSPGIGFEEKTEELSRFFKKS